MTLLAVGFIGGGLYLGFQQTSLTQISEIKFKGASEETVNRLQHLLTIKVGDPFWEIPIAKEAEILSQDPWVKKVDFNRQLPNILIINVVERKPLAVLGTKKGRFKFVDSSNKIIDRARPGQIGGYPILMGRNLIRDMEKREKALNLVKSLPSKGVLSRLDVSEIYFKKNHGFQIVLGKTRSTINIGKNNLALHLDRSRRVAEYLKKHEINASHIDADYAKKVLVKVRKAR